jgi:hypothetical protein
VIIHVGRTLAKRAFLRWKQKEWEARSNDRRHNEIKDDDKFPFPFPEEANRWFLIHFQGDGGEGDSKRENQSWEDEFRSKYNSVIKKLNHKSDFVPPDAIQMFEVWKSLEMQSSDQTIDFDTYRVDEWKKFISYEKGPATSDESKNAHEKYLLSKTWYADATNEQQQREDEKKRVDTLSEEEQIIERIRLIDELDNLPDVKLLRNDAEAAGFTRNTHPKEFRQIDEKLEKLEKDEKKRTAMADASSRRHAPSSMTIREDSETGQKTLEFYFSSSSSDSGNAANPSGRP